jgi:hypothetical protein
LFLVGNKDNKNLLSWMKGSHAIAEILQDCEIIKHSTFYTSTIQTSYNYYTITTNQILMNTNKKYSQMQQICAV